MIVIIESLSQHYKYMNITANIAVPEYSRFLFSPDQQTLELYITCTSPLALIWVQQTTPAQLWIVEGPQDEQLLLDAGAWWRENAVKNMGGN